MNGYLLLRIEEACGRTKKDEFVWEKDSEDFQAFVKGKLGPGLILHHLTLQHKHATSRQLIHLWWLLDTCILYFTSSAAVDLRGGAQNVKVGLPQCFDGQWTA